ncbi:hypothetical protein C8R45DRAFT_1100813 [Mycena sanguinolenta]|nr:hypothetical protein C8R45DRAFT_1100813 [Mycena sanguinolenta]
MVVERINGPLATSRQHRTRRRPRIAIPKTQTRTRSAYPQLIALAWSRARGSYIATRLLDIARALCSARSRQFWVGDGRAIYTQVMRAYGAIRAMRGASQHPALVATRRQARATAAQHKCAGVEEVPKAPPSSHAPKQTRRRAHCRGRNPTLLFSTSARDAVPKTRRTRVPYAHGPGYARSDPAPPLFFVPPLACLASVLRLHVPCSFRFRIAPCGVSWSLPHSPQPSGPRKRKRPSTQYSLAESMVCAPITPHRDSPARSEVPNIPTTAGRRTDLNASHASSRGQYPAPSRKAARVASFRNRPLGSWGHNTRTHASRRRLALSAPRPTSPLAFPPSRTNRAVPINPPQRVRIRAPLRMKSRAARVRRR